MDEVFTSKELANYLKVNQMTVYRLANQGKIPGNKVGDQWRFNKKTIDKWLSEKGGKTLVGYCSSRKGEA